MPIKLTTITEGAKREKKNKKSKRTYRTRQNIRVINVFLESLLSESFPSLGVTDLNKSLISVLQPHKYILVLNFWFS